MRFVRTALLLLISVWVPVTPHPALAQSLGSLVVKITSPAPGSTVSGSTTVSASVTIIGSLTVAGVQFKLDGNNLGAEDTSAPYAVSWNTTTSANGSHILTAVGRDLLGLKWTSDPVTVTVSNDTTPPAVVITSPSSGSTVSGTIGVTASASDNVGVVGVQFRLDGANLGAEDTSAPYSISWNTTSASNASHTLTARARDAAGNTTTSAAVTVSVNNTPPDTTPPTVSITSPSSGSTVSGTIAMTASAADNVGVAGVQFKLDGVNFGAADTSAPYSVSWDTTTASNGSHTLVAQARDAAGNTTTSAAVSVTVSNGPPPDTTPPTVSITSPASSSTVSGTINVTASASDNVGVVGVQFMLDGGNLGGEDATAPYSVSWNTSTASPGSHTLTARARDAAGNATTSSAIAVTVSDTTSPTVSITSPSSGSTVSGTVSVTASASDNAGVAGVQFLLDGGNLGAEDTAAPYSVSWNTTTASPGSHTLTARARDAAGNATTSSAVTVTVSDTAPPTVSITSPSSGATVTGTTTVTATASDNAGVAGVQFKLDGATLGAEDTSAPFSVSWNTTTATNGSHTLTAQARDAAGNTTISAGVTVTVSNTPPDTTPPTVSITSPSSGATVSGTITVSAAASDNVGVAGVQFKLDGADLGGEDSSAPYSISWDTTTAGDGSHTLTARARDAAGNATTSSAITVTVTNGAADTMPPTVSITSPASGSTVCGPVTVTADASDNVGVTGVQFRLDGNPIGVEDTSAPYSVSWDTTTTSNGSHTLTAGARDAAGNTTTSSPVTVAVSNDGSDCVPPTVAITAPASGSTVAGTITITASASDNVGVGGVEFRIDGTSAVEDTTAPYAVSWNTTTASNGSHTLTAIARDAAGNRTTSAPVSVTVANDTTPLECTVPLDAFPGNTLFNNTVRAQMWIIDSTWWGVFSDNSTGIYFYKLQGSTFIKGDFIDPSFAAGKPDTLWNGSELFVVVQQSGSLAKLYKYSYLPATESFVLTAGFPVDLPLSGSAVPAVANAVALHQDSTDKLWATYAAGSNVRVIWSTSGDHRTWDTTGFILAPDVSALTTEAAAIMHFGGDKIGVVWGNQNLREYAFRFHRDGDPETTWSPKEIIDCCNSQDGGVADDHLSLRAAPDGRLFLVAKDSIGTGNLYLYVRDVNGVWGQKARVDSDPQIQPTRPTLALHVENDQAYAVYRNSTDGRTYVARSSMSSTGFGLRCVFLNQGTSMTSTKQNVTASTGLVVAHSDTGQIFSARMDLPTTPSSVTFAGASERTTPTVPASALNVDDPRGQVRPSAGRVAAGPPDVPPDPPAVPGFNHIWNGRLSISDVPANDSQWWWLRQQRVNTIVNLDAVMYDFVQYAFESFFWMPVGAAQAPADESAASFLKFIQSCDNVPAHLLGGAADVRAMLVALLRYAVDAWTIEAAMAEGQRLNGATPLSEEQVTWLLGWAATHSPGSERLNSCLGMSVR